MYCIYYNMLGVQTINKIGLFQPAACWPLAALVGCQPDKYVS
jgi:hypothetical protein